MKSTKVASIVVLVSSLSIGLATGYLSYYLGTQSLTGVSSPEENPTQKISNLGKNNGGKSFQFMSEKAVLVKVYDHIHTEREASKVKEKQ